jgi:hypothetical protein
MGWSREERGNEVVYYYKRHLFVSINWLWTIIEMNFLNPPILEGYEKLMNESMFAVIGLGGFEFIPPHTIKGL